MSKSIPTASLLVTDLDNTLFDWFSPWYHAFLSMTNYIINETNIDRAKLYHEIKSIHQLHGTSEYSYLIQEIPSLASLYPNEDLGLRFETAIKNYRSERDLHLRRFPSVLYTLTELKKRGVLIVGYTESMGLYSNYRINKLGLDGILDYLYLPEDHKIPKNMTQEPQDKYFAQRHSLSRTKVRFTPPDELKPNPSLLLDIIEEVGGSPTATAYVGDNLWKDVQMAQGAGAYDVYASYGSVHKTEEYELLKAVTHWTDDDVERENKLREDDVQPQFVIKRYYSELLDMFMFYPNPSIDHVTSSSITKNQIEIWQKIVEVQEHFNDIEMKIRNLALVVVGAVLAGVGYALKSKISFTVSEASIPVAPIILASGALILGAFWFMDRHWYHRLLYGAVKEGARVERLLNIIGYRCNLTETIGEESPIQIGRYELHSSHKIDVFYGFLAFLLLISAGFLSDVSIGLFIVSLFLLSIARLACYTRK